MSKREDDKNFLCNVIAGNEDVTKRVSTPYGEFILRLATPRQKVRISRTVSGELGGANASLFAITDRDMNYTRMVVVLDEVVEKAPSGWKSAGDCLDEALLERLYKEYLELEASFREKVEKFHRRGTVSDNADRASSNDLLSDTADGSEVEKPASAPKRVVS